MISFYEGLFIKFLFTMVSSSSFFLSSFFHQGFMITSAAFYRASMSFIVSFVIA